MNKIIMHQRCCQDSIKRKKKNSVEHLQKIIRMKDMQIERLHKIIKDLNADIKGAM